MCPGRTLRLLQRRRGAVSRQNPRWPNFDIFESRLILAMYTYGQIRVAVVATRKGVMREKRFSNQAPGIDRVYFGDRLRCSDSGIRVP